MVNQCVTDLASWGLNEKSFMTLVTNTAVNMNLLGGMMEQKYTHATMHYYCSDHNLQMMVPKAYTGDITLQMGGVAPDGGSIDHVLNVLKRHMT